MKGYFVFFVDDQIFFLVDLGPKVPLLFQSVGQDFQILLPVVTGFWREKRDIQIAGIVVNGATSAITTCHFDIFPVEQFSIGFDPGILMAADDHARIVPPEQHDVVVGEVEILVHPVFESEIGEDVPRLRYEHGLGQTILAAGGSRGAQIGRRCHRCGIFGHPGQQGAAAALPHEHRGEFGAFHCRINSEGHLGSLLLQRQTEKVLFESVTRRNSFRNKSLRKHGKCLYSTKLALVRR